MDTTIPTMCNRKVVLRALEEISSCAPGERYSLDAFNQASVEERNMLFSILSCLDIIQISDNKFSLTSESALLFIKSIIQYMKNDLKILSSWGESSPIPSSMSSHNIFHASTFLYCLEQHRKELCVDVPFEPIKEEALIRVVLKRKIWGRDHVLMQYDPHVDAYQLIGGIVKKEDNGSFRAALKRKLHEELPQIELNENNCHFDDIYSSAADQEEVFLSKKFKVYVRYKTRIYNARPKNQLNRSTLKKINENPNNRWISFAEIEKGLAGDKKAVFPLQARALAEIKKEQNVAFKADFSLGDLLKKTWVQVLLALCTILGISVWGVLQEFWGLVKLFP